MPSLICGCGEILPYGEIAYQNEGLLIYDIEFEEFYGQEDTEEIGKSMKSFIKCPNCGTIWYFWDGF
jgi:hypothetical protein